MKLKHLSPAQHSALLANAQSTRTPEALLFAVLAVTGMRADELAKVSFADVDAKTGAVAIKGSKRSHDRSLHLPQWLLAALMASSACIDTAANSLMAVLHPNFSGALSPKKLHNAKQCLRERWRSYRLAIGAKGLGMHCLRHSVAMRMLEKTDNIRKVAAVLGHKNINNTIRYLNYVDSLEASKELMGIFSNDESKGAA